MTCDFLNSLLSAKGQGGDPPTIHVVVSNSDEILSLRSQLDDLRDENLRLIQQIRRLEYEYGCEVRVNEQIIDIARAHGVDIPSRLKKSVR